MKHRPVLISLAAVTLVVGGIVVGAVAHAATRNVSCPGTVTDTATTYTVNVQCQFPKPAPVTATVTATVTAIPSPSGSATATPTPSPTPTPTPTPTASPSPPAVGFPDASNTGVPAGTTLTAYTGSCTITSAVTIDAKTLDCPALQIQAAGVTIARSKINGRVLVDTDTNSSWSLTLSDSEVNANGIPNVPAITSGNVAILRANVHGAHNGLQCEEHSRFCSMKDSWVHDQYAPAGTQDHFGGITSFGSVMTCTGPSAGGVPACVEWVHNRIACDVPVSIVTGSGGCTGDANLLAQFGPVHGALITDNLMVASTSLAFCTYGGGASSGNKGADHVIYTGNVFQRGTNGRCGDYGPVTAVDPGVGNVWTNNLWDDGTPVAPSS